MRIGDVAARLGITSHAIRLYERDGLVPQPVRAANGYRDYSERDVERLRLLIGLRQLDLPLVQAAELAGMCAAGRCDEVSAELRTVLAVKRTELRRRMAEMRHLDQRMAHLQGNLAAGEAPRPLIGVGKEDWHEAM